jgi:hypothetical protein
VVKKKLSVLSGWAFLVGVVLAVIFGFMGEGNLNQSLVYSLVIIGLVVGLLNIADKESTPFLIAGAVLILASNFGQDAVEAVPRLGNVLNALLLLFVPATVIVAIRHVFNMAKS